MLIKVSVLLVVTFMTLGSGCSTYNSIVPDWASIESSSSQATKSEINNDSGSWCNTFSWF